jgi:hypothetical protein
VTCRVEVTWTCERCDLRIIFVLHEEPYSDPLLVPPEGWDYAKDGNTHLCATCLQKEANP